MEDFECVMTIDEFSMNDGEAVPDEIAQLWTSDKELAAYVCERMRDVYVVVSDPLRASYIDPTLEFGRMISIGYEPVISRVENHVELKGIQLAYDSPLLKRKF